MPIDATAAARPVQAFVGVGANLGDRAATVEAACRDIAALPGVRLVSMSSLYVSAPLAAVGDDFFNAVVQVATTLDPHELLGCLQSIETNHGRERPFRNAPRTLDLDLLLYGDRTIDTPSLVVPHPRMAERAFVLIPLAEIAPCTVVPGAGAVEALAARVRMQRIAKLVR